MFDLFDIGKIVMMMKTIEEFASCSLVCAEVMCPALRMIGYNATNDTGVTNGPIGGR